MPSLPSSGRSKGYQESERKRGKSRRQSVWRDKSSGVEFAEEASSVSSSSLGSRYAEFYFQERLEELDWKTLLQIDIERVISHTDLDTLEQITKNITFGRIVRRDLKFVSEDDCLHVFQLSQLIVEYLLYVQQYLVDRKSATENDIAKLLDDVRTLKMNAAKHKQQIQFLKKDLRRQKRTIFAYQLVFGANPERTKLLLQQMRDGKLDFPSQNTESSTEHVHALNAQLQQVKQENESLRARIAHLTKAPHSSSPDSSEIHKRLDEIQKHHQAQTTAIQGQISNVVQQISKIPTTKSFIHKEIKAQLAQNDLKVIDFVERKLGELLPTLVSEKQKDDVMSLSSSVKEIKGKLRASYAASPSPTQEAAPHTEPDPPSPAPISPHPSRQPTQHTAPQKPSLRTSLKNSIRKPVPQLDTSSSVQSKQRHLVSKLKKEMDLPTTVTVHNENIPHKVSGTQNIRSRFKHKPEDFDLQKEIVCYEFENFLSKRKLNVSTMDATRFNNGIKDIEAQREQNDPELNRVLEDVRDIVDGIVMSHNPQWAKFFHKKPNTAHRKHPEKINSHQSASKLKPTSSSHISSGKKIARAVHNLSIDTTSAAANLVPSSAGTSSPSSALKESSLEAQTENASEKPTEQNEQAKQRAEPDLDAPPPQRAHTSSPLVTSKPPVDPNNAPSRKPQRENSLRTRSKLRASVSTSYSRTSGDTFGTSSYTGDTYASTDYSSESDSDVNSEFDQEEDDKKSERMSYTEESPTPAEKPESQLHEQVPQKEHRTEVIEETHTKKTTVTTDTTTAPEERKTTKESTNHTRQASEAEQASPTPQVHNSVIPIENLESETTVTPRSARVAQVMNISAASVTQSELSDSLSPVVVGKKKANLKSLSAIKNQMTRNSPVILKRKSTDSAFTEELGLESFEEHTPRRQGQDKQSEAASDTQSALSEKTNEEWHKEKQSDIDNVLKQLHGAEKDTSREEAAPRRESESSNEPIQVVSRAKSVKSEQRDDSMDALRNPFSKGLSNPFSGAASQGMKTSSGKFLASSMEMGSSSFGNKGRLAKNDAVPTMQDETASEEEASKAADVSQLNLSEELTRGLDELDEDNMSAASKEEVEHKDNTDELLEQEMQGLDEPMSMELKSEVNESRAIEEDDLDAELEQLQDFDDEELGGAFAGHNNKQSIDFEVLDEVDDEIL